MATVIYAALGMGSTLQQCQVNSGLHPLGVAKSSTSFCCEGGNVTSAGWQVTLVSSYGT